MAVLNRKRPAPFHHHAPRSVSLRRTASAAFPFSIHVLNRIDAVSSHDHDFIEIIYIYHGSGIHEIAGKRSPVKAAEIVILPPGVKHAFPAKTNTWHKHAVVAFDPSLFNGWKTDVNVQGLIDVVMQEKNYRYSVAPNNIAAIESSIDSLCYEHTLQDAEYQNAIRLDLLRFLLICRRTVLGPPSGLSGIDDSEPAVNFALVSMEQNYMNIRSLSDIMGSLKMNKRYFIGLFKKKVHLTPIQYLNRLRIEKSLPSLAAKDSTVLQEAYACGFRDIAHYNRLFKRFLGMSPMEFKQKAMLGKIDTASYRRFSFREKK